MRTELELIHKYIDGLLNEAEEMAMFANLAGDEVMRNELRNIISMRESIAKNSSTRIPPESLTNSLFSTLGYATPINLTDNHVGSDIDKNDIDKSDIESKNTDDDSSVDVGLSDVKNNKRRIILSSILLALMLGTPLLFNYFNNNTSPTVADSSSSKNVSFDKKINLRNKLNLEDKLNFDNNKSGFLSDKGNPKNVSDKVVVENTFNNKPKTEESRYILNNKTEVAKNNETKGDIVKGNGLKNLTAKNLYSNNNIIQSKGNKDFVNPTQASKNKAYKEIRNENITSRNGDMKNYTQKNDELKNDNLRNNNVIDNEGEIYETKESNVYKSVSTANIITTFIDKKPSVLKNNFLKKELIAIPEKTQAEPNKAALAVNNKYTFGVRYISELGFHSPDGMPDKGHDSTRTVVLGNGQTGLNNIAMSAGYRINSNFVVGAEYGQESFPIRIKGADNSYQDVSSMNYYGGFIEHSFNPIGSLESLFLNSKLVLGLTDLGYCGKFILAPTYQILPNVALQAGLESTFNRFNDETGTDFSKPDSKPVKHDGEGHLPIKFGISGGINFSF